MVSTMLFSQEGRFRGSGRAPRSRDHRPVRPLGAHGRSCPGLCPIVRSDLQSGRRYPVPCVGSIAVLAAVDTVLGARGRRHEPRSVFLVSNRAVLRLIGQVTFWRWRLVVMHRRAPPLPIPRVATTVVTARQRCRCAPGDPVPRTSVKGPHHNHHRTSPPACHEQMLTPRVDRVDLTLRAADVPWG